MQFEQRLVGLIKQFHPRDHRSLLKDMQINAPQNFPSENILVEMQSQRFLSDSKRQLLVAKIVRSRNPDSDFFKKAKMCTILFFLEKNAFLQVGLLLSLRNYI